MISNRHQVSDAIVERVLRETLELIVYAGLP